MKRQQCDFLGIHPLTWTLTEELLQPFWMINISLLYSAVSHSTASWACRQIPPDVLRCDWLSKLFPHWPQSPSLVFLLWCRRASAKDCGWSRSSHVRRVHLSASWQGAEHPSSEIRQKDLISCCMLGGKCITVAALMVKHQSISDILVILRLWITAKIRWWHWQEARHENVYSVS